MDLSPVRNQEAIVGVNTALNFAEPGEFPTILFTGHRGCGKSTELKQIERRGTTDYRVIYLEITEEIDVNNAEYIDLYLVVIKWIEFELSSRIGSVYDYERFFDTVYNAKYIANFRSIYCHNAESHLAFILLGLLVTTVTDCSPTLQLALSPAGLTALIGHQTALTNVLG